MASTWIKERLNKIHKSSEKTVVAIVLDKSEIQDSASTDSNFNFIHHLSKSKEFR
jgi:hypothetical protein